ncbi:class I SAM-dependent methyltransferase [Candidatus Parabeggiatoa sp. HSG14]|uniref:class I SAM-dependent methyltransferase n=1 Tax=Candidatus Parabeggiatoa sp. HSG14 TaxID=3055593 RepID=UPI0025A70AF9|nr:class I SAM-dependent methyltransferase [Thiotrichales bacterium HSG14]
MWPLANKEVFNIRQKKIRDLEWCYAERCIRNYLPGSFLDVGCGTGYALSKAQKLGFSVTGTEPEIGMHGVINSSNLNDLIIKAVAEDLPFENDKFDVVYSSHALEHFQDRKQGLKEINRILNKKGIAIIVVPTGTMAFVNFISQLMFTTHIRMGRFIVKEPSLVNLKRIFLPQAHGSYAGSVLSETQDFSVKKWQKLISKYMDIQEVVLPSLYPYPDFPQFFPFIKSNKFSSSVIFIGKKKYQKI